MKRFCVVVLIVCLILSFVNEPVTLVQAGSTTDAVSPGVGTRWINTVAVSMGMEFTGNRVDCAVDVVGMQGTTSISAVIKLYRQNYDGSLTHLTTFPTESSNWEYLYFSDSYFNYRICPINIYILTIDAKVTRNGVTEDIYEELERTYFYP